MSLYNKTLLTLLYPSLAIKLAENNVFNRSNDTSLAEVVCM